MGGLHIANNPDIDTIYDEDHPKIAAALDDLNAALTSAPPLPIKPSDNPINKVAK